MIPQCEREITETITNENGVAIKYSDGTMKCFGSIKFTDVNIDKAYGNLYVETTGRRTIKFPVQFKDVPDSLMLYPKQFGGGIGGVCGNNVDTKIATFWLWNGNTYNFTNKEMEISFEAKGRWK